MSVQDIVEAYETRLRERWTPDGEPKIPEGLSLASIIDKYGVVGGRNGEIYLGEDACREAGLPTVIRMKG